MKLSKINVKKLFTGLTALAITGIVVSGVMSLNHVEAKAPEVLGRVTVSGEGKVKVAPDVAYVTVGVTTQNEIAKTAQDENNKDMTNLIDALKEAGIDEKDMKTTGYSIYPTYSNKQNNKIDGYTVSNTVSVTIKDLDMVGSVLETALANGGNIASGIQFGVIDSSKYYEEALGLAIDNATAKGKAIAKKIGKAVDLPIEITETGGNYSPYLRQEAMYAQYALADTGGIAIQSGELNITANIQAVFEYK